MFAYGRGTPVRRVLTGRRQLRQQQRALELWVRLTLQTTLPGEAFGHAPLSNSGAKSSKSSPSKGDIDGVGGGSNTASPLRGLGRGGAATCADTPDVGEDVRDYTESGHPEIGFGGCTSFGQDWGHPGSGFGHDRGQDRGAGGRRGGHDWEEAGRRGGRDGGEGGGGATADVTRRGEDEMTARAEEALGDGEESGDEDASHDVKTLNP